MTTRLDPHRPQQGRGSIGDGLLRTLFAAASPAGARARLTTLIFHRVLPAPDPLFPDEPDAHRFDQLCGWLAQWFRVLPLDEAVARLAAGSLPARALCISFDDGYADNHDIAMPILRAHGLTATFFIASGFIGGGRMWNDTLAESVRRCSHEQLDVSGLGLADLARLDVTSDDARRRAVRQLLGAAKYLPHDERHRVAARVAERAGRPLPDNLMMTAGQVRAMADAGMQIGAHTVNHPVLVRLDEQRAAREIEQSKSEVEAMIGRPVTLFAYPNGIPGRDYGQRDAALVRRSGFRSAVSTASGSAATASSLFELPRFAPWEVSRGKLGLRLLRNLFDRGATAPA